MFELREKIQLLTLCLIGVFGAWFVSSVPSCGTEVIEKQDVPSTSQPPVGTPPPGGCNKVTFTEVKPLITAKCISCHRAERYDEYQQAKSAIDQFIERVSLPDNNPRRMPKGGEPLAQGEKDVLLRWKVDGLSENCNGQLPSPKKKVVFNEAEQAMFGAVNGLDISDRIQTRFLVLTNKLNEGASEEEISKTKQAANKAINGLNGVERKLLKLKEIGPEGAILQIRLEDFGLNRIDWEKIIAADPLKLESFTNTGVILKQLTQTRRPWIEVADFIDVTHRNSRLYYDLVRAPNTFQELVQKLGVNFSGDLRDFKAFLIGEANSVLSLGKNRLVSRFESRDGYFWMTFDPLAIDAQTPQRNLFKFPLLAQAGGKANFDFAASEVIYSLPNGLQGYFLTNAQGVRQNAAPTNIVQDNSGQNPKGSEIVNASSCSRCHNGGLIPLTDQVRDSVIQNAVLFDARDVEIVRRLYKVGSANSALFDDDNRTFEKNLGAVGVSPGADPLVFATDRLLLNWNLNQLASYLFFEKEEFRLLLGQSATGRAELGQLLVDKTVTYDQIIQSLPKVIEELRIFQDELGK